MSEFQVGDVVMCRDFGQSANKPWVQAVVVASYQGRTYRVSIANSRATLAKGGKIHALRREKEMTRLATVAWVECVDEG